MTYAALQREHVAAAAVYAGRREGKRVAKYGPRCHAAIVTAIEAKGMGVFEMSKDEIVKLVFPSLALSGLMGLLFNGIIQWVLGLLIPRVIQWLRDKLDGWLDRNKSIPRASVSLYAVDDMAPIFSDARTFLQSGRWE